MTTPSTPHVEVDDVEPAVESKHITPLAPPARSKPRLALHWAVFSSAVALAACGGGGDSGTPAPAPAPTATAPAPGPVAPSPSPSPATAPPVTGTPTTTITASQTTASSLAAIGKSGAASLAQAGSLNGVPLGVLVSPPNGVVSSGTVQCPGGGSYTFSYTFANSSTATLAVGDGWSATYTNCSYVAGDSVNGTVAATYTRYNSAQDIALEVTVTNYTTVYNGVTTFGPYNYDAVYSMLNGVYSYSYTVNGSTVVGQPVVVTSGNNVTIDSGTVRVNYGNGWVEIAYSNWQYDSTTGLPLSGTATVTASNGDSAIITVNAPNYTVALSIGGVQSTYSVPF